MYNFVSEEKNFFKILRLISLRLKFILTVRIFLRLCCLLLSGLSIYALYLFLFYGDVFKIRFFLKIFIFSAILFIPVSAVVGFFKKVQLKYAVDKVDFFLSLDDRLNACFEIVTKKSNWGGWNFSLLTDTSKKIIYLPLKTISEIFPLNCKKVIIVFNILICFLAGVWVIGHSKIGTKWRVYRLQSYLLAQSQILFDYSNKVVEPKHKQLSVSLQKTARTIKKTARAVSEKNLFTVKKNLFENLDVSLK
ncbi:hypothetical protein J7L67_04390, partial [bacterium]|nr:hypothetical protein [bacterium]